MHHEILEPGRAVFRIGAVAELLGVHPRTLRLYEERGLITPERVRSQRRYSHNDIRWLGCLRGLIHEDGYSIDAITKLLEFVPCWELRKCPAEIRETCTAAINRRLPCWEIAARTCQRAEEMCSVCEVYIQANEAASAVADDPAE